MWPQSLNYNRNFFILLEKKKKTLFQVTGIVTFPKKFTLNYFNHVRKGQLRLERNFFLLGMLPLACMQNRSILSEVHFGERVCVFKTETLCTITSGRSSTEQTNRERCATSSRNGGRCMVAQQFQLYFPREIYLSITFMAFWQFWNHFWNSFMSFVFQN